MPDTLTRTFAAGPGLEAYTQACIWLGTHGFAVARRDGKTAAPCGALRKELVGPGAIWRDGRIEPAHGKAYEGDAVKLTLRADLVPASEEPGDWEGTS